MKINTILKRNQQLKLKIGQELKSKKATGVLDLGKLSQKISTTGKVTIGTPSSVSLAKESNTINAPSTDKISSKSTSNIPGVGVGTVVHDPNYRAPVDDGRIIGGFRIVNTIAERNSIDCCFRKLGMVVMVVGPDFSFTEFILTGELCSNDGWVEYIGTNYENDVILTEDYSDLSPQTIIETQKDLNQVLKDILQQILDTPPFIETDPTVPQHVKDITTQDITNWNQNGDKTYVHDQHVPSTIWSINHNLGKKPAVHVVDTANNVVEGEIDYEGSDSHLTITFNYPFAGYATLN